MNFKYLKYALALVPAFGLTACMDFDNPGDEYATTDVTVDPTPLFGDADNLEIKDIDEETLDAAIASLNTNFGQLITAQYYIAGGKDGTQPGEHQWQYIYNLNTDNYCGYCTADQNWNGQLESTYSYYRDFCEGPYGRFLSMKTYLGNFLNNDLTNNVVELKAIALLLFDHAAQEVTDIYGAIPYLDHKSNVQSNPFEFNKGYDIYSAIVKNIDDIVNVFDNFENRPDWYKEKIQNVLDFYDVMTIDKQISTWKRYANSLKLRMALHIVKYDKNIAKTWAEEAVASGVIEGQMQQVVLCTLTDFFASHPLKVIMSSWNDSRANASFISMLASLKHPYYDYLVDTNSHDMVNVNTGEVTPQGTVKVGLRAGLRMYNGQQYESNTRTAYSQFTSDDFSYMPVYIMKWAEVDFHRAEGALYGWNMGGTPQFFYERGIENADCGDVFGYPTNNYQSALEKYMELTEAVPFTYVDPEDSVNNMESVTKIGVKWNDSDDHETKLEKIMTQKYIAIFPYSYEAWTDIRRTGYPKIFPVLNPGLGDFSLNDGDLIRRCHLPNSGIQAGVDDVNNSGLDAIGGADLYSTRVFWDIDKPNF